MADWEPNETKETITQLASPPAVTQSGNECEKSGCEESGNLWLNLSTGRVLCGQAQADGSGGQGHASEDFEAGDGANPLVVKLGTISPDGADVVSYSEGGDLVIDPKLKEHLAHFGLDMDKCTKTEPSMKELELAAK